MQTAGIIEIWKPLLNYKTKDITYEFNPKYEISNTGKIRNIKTKEEISYCEDHLLEKGSFHRRTRICAKKINGKSVRPHVIIARAVAMNFIKVNGLTEDDLIKLEVDHIDGNPLNDSVDNLQWCLPKENKKFNGFGSGHYSIISEQTREGVDY